MKLVPSEQLVLSFNFLYLGLFSFAQVIVPPGYCWPPAYLVHQLSYTELVVLM